MIITSLLDTDLYKFTMMQAVLHQFPGAQVQYKFKCRTPGVQLTPYLEEIEDEIRQLCELRVSEGELDYLRGMRFIKSDFVDFLGLFRLNREIHHPHAAGQRRNRHPRARPLAAHHPVRDTRCWPSSARCITATPSPCLDRAEGRRRLDTKIAQMQAPGLRELKIADYGTRRRFSRDWQREVLGTLKARLGCDADGQLTGTSNVMLARELDLRPMGTMAHEYLQACQALGPRLRDTQVFGFESWAQEYRGDLGIALSDVYGMNAFLRDFDMYFCKLFDGARHDSRRPV
jgi:nicotinate phosphoribosyltransferase